MSNRRNTSDQTELQYSLLLSNRRNTSEIKLNYLGVEYPLLFPSCIAVILVHSAATITASVSATTTAAAAAATAATTTTTTTTSSSSSFLILKILVIEYTKSRRAVWAKRSCQQDDKGQRDDTKREILN